MPHILIVEDEPTTSWALAEGLSDDGYTIDTFRTGEEALVWLRSHRSDLVITDFRLPGMSGLELAQKLSRGRHAQPVIVVTAYGSPETVRELVRAGSKGSEVTVTTKNGFVVVAASAAATVADLKALAAGVDRKKLAALR